MGIRITNNHAVSLPLAVWLAADGYDFSAAGRRAISATSLLKPVRQILLRERLTQNDVEIPDVVDFIPARLGHTIHDGIEKAWRNDCFDSLRKLGYPQGLIDAIVINPETVEDSQIPVYVEQRYERQIMGYIVSGKFDMILEGELQDFKSTSVYSWIKGGKDEDYRLQGSIYKWLNPEKVTSDHIAINFIFTDWQRSRARQSPDTYPEHRIMTHRVPLMSVEETDLWIRNKFKELERYAELPESELPRCSFKDLWMSDPEFKYYADPKKATEPGARASRNFGTDRKAAYAHKAEKGKGAVVGFSGQAKACGYCPAFNICTQKDEYEHG